MPGNRFDVRNVAQHIAEGRGDDVLKERAAYRTPDPQHPSFLRFVVLDVISDPTTIDNVKLSYWEHTLGVANIQVATVAPRNSIIARRVMGQANGGASEKVMLLYPFCPPSISMPAKPGEHVWAMFENPGAKVNEIGYWLWKIVQPDYVEDVNYTHADRALDPSFLPGLSDVFEGTASPKYEFHNGGQTTDMTSNDPYTMAETSTIPQDPLGLGTMDADAGYTDILTKSEAGTLAQYESVPRYRKRPQDTAFEGSNNTLIVLGTDRTGAYADTSATDPNTGVTPKPVTKDVAGGAGAIDLVAGRGQTDATAGKPVQNKLNNKELGKDKQNLAPAEGDVDLVNDRTRVLIAQKTKVDTNFQLNTAIEALTTSKPVSDSDGSGAIVVKTDKVRIVARQDVVIMVVGPDAVGGDAQTDNNGNIKDPATGGASVTKDQCASIIIRTNGDIVFTPGALGVVRLGGDDAALAPLCSMVGPTPGMLGPIPPPSPIVDTMGGAQGGLMGLNGTFATKVLLK